MKDRDLFALADAVGVLDPNTRYLLQLERMDQQHRQRMDYLKGAGVFSALFTAYLLVAFQIGAHR